MPRSPKMQARKKFLYVPGPSWWLIFVAAGYGGFNFGFKFAQLEAVALPRQSHFIVGAMTTATLANGVFAIAKASVYHIEKLGFILITIYDTLTDTMLPLLSTPGFGEMFVEERKAFNELKASRLRTLGSVHNAEKELLFSVYVRVGATLDGWCMDRRETRILGENPKLKESVD